MLRPIVLLQFVAFIGVASPTLAQSATSSSEPAAGDSAATPPTAVQQEAAQRFEHAVKLYADAEYALALAEFERVYDLVPDYRVLYNIGQVSMQLGRYARALRALDEYLERGGTQVEPSRKAQVAADLESLKGRVARLEIAVEPVGAEIFLDGVSVGSAPLAKPVVADVGTRRIQVRLSGYQAKDETLRLAGGDQRALKFVLEREPERPKAPAEIQPGRLESRLPAPPPPAAAPAGSSSLRWVGWTTAGALAAAAGVTGALGIGAANDLSQERESGTATRESLNAAEQRARTFLLTADLLGAAALVTSGVALYFELKRPAREQHGQSRPGSLKLALAPRSVCLTFEH